MVGSKLKDINQSIDFYLVSKWLCGMLLTGAMAWATWVTNDLKEYKNVLTILSERLTRIETKLDMLMEKK